MISKLYTFRKVFFALLFVCLSLTSCQEADEQIIVTDNAPPSDNTISESAKKSYVSRLYIDLLGRKPTQVEESTALGFLENTPKNSQSRENVVASILEKEEYFSNEIIIINATLLNKTPAREIDQQIFVFNLLLRDQNNAPAFDRFRYEIARLEQLKITPQEFLQGRIDIKTVYTRYINNIFYDDINMGSENYVISTFQHFLLRAPTRAELEEGVLMVENFPSKSFLQNGDSKNDYNEALVNSIGYYEGQTRLLFERFLFRDATPEEIGVYAQRYSNTQNYKDLQTQILISDEYAGF